MRYSRDEDVLCCCEYFNQDGDRAHLLGLLCDCVEVDDAFDRMIRWKWWCNVLSSTSLNDLPNAIKLFTVVIYEFS
jgi:hypothetical protein